MNYAPEKMKNSFDAVRNDSLTGETFKTVEEQRADLEQLSGWHSTGGSIARKGVPYIASGFAELLQKNGRSFKPSSRPHSRMRRHQEKVC